MRTGKRKCCSAPEQRNKRNKTGIMNKVEKAASILCETDGMPFATFEKALEELKDNYMAIFFIEMGWKRRLEWLYHITPPGKMRAFNRWRKTFPLQQ